MDRPVHIWQTAIPLAEVLGEIERQTGVRVGLWSLDDSSREVGRIRLNLYLNPGDPPSLRSLLAQLSWVLDYAIACRPAGAGVDMHYDVLCSDPGPAAVDALSRAMNAAWIAHGDLLDSQRQRMAAKLDRYREALALPLPELVARYRDVDETLLFDLTDPPRRALASFIFGLPSEEQQTLARDGGISLKWDALGQEERSLLGEAFPAPAAPVAEVKVDCVGDATQVSLRRGPETPSPPGAEERGWGMRVAPSLDLMRTPESLSSDEAVSRARALAKVTTQAEEEAYRRKLAERKREVANTFRARQHEEQAMRQRDLETVLPTMATRLSGLSLPLDVPKDGRAMWTLWEVQQAVAKAAGVNIISDCYWQPRRPLLQPRMSEGDSYLSTSPVQQITALLALRGATFGGVDPLGQDIVSRIPLSRYPTRPAWEWGDAGTFLRFRSMERDLWRASLLPADAVVELDEAYELSAAAPPAGRAAAAMFDLGKLAALAGKLSDLQFLFGACMVYGDPEQDEEDARQAFRFAALMPVGVEGTPTEIQWYLCTFAFFPS